MSGRDARALCDGADCCLLAACPQLYSGLEDAFAFYFGTFSSESVTSQWAGEQTLDQQPAKRSFRLVAECPISGDARSRPPSPFFSLHGVASLP